MSYKNISDIRHTVSLDPSYFKIKEKVSDMLIKGSTTETLITELKKPKMCLYKDMSSSQKKLVKKSTFNSENQRNAEKIVQLLKTYQSFRDFIKINHIDDNSLKKAANHFGLIFQPKGNYLYKETDNISNFYCIIDGKISMRKERFVKKENKNTKKVLISNRIKFDSNITKLWRNKLKYIQYNDNMLNLFLNGIISFSANRDKYKSNYNSINTSSNNLNLNNVQASNNNKNSDLTKLNNQINTNDSNKAGNSTPSSCQQVLQNSLNHSPKTSKNNFLKSQDSYPIHESSTVSKTKTSKKINKRFEKNNLYNKLMNLYRNDDYTTYQEDIYTEGDGFCFGPLGLIYRNHLSLSIYCLKDTYFITLTEEEFDYCFNNCIQNSEEVRKIFLQNNICSAQVNKNPQLNLNINININSILSISNPILCNIGDTVYEEGKKAEKIFIVYLSGFSLNKKIKSPNINNNFIEKNYRILNLNKGSIIGLESFYEKSGCYKYTLRADCAGEVGIVICLELRKMEEDLLIKLKNKFYEYYQILERTCTMSLAKQVDCINKVKNKFNFIGDNNKSSLDENKIIVKPKDNYLSDCDKVKKKLDHYFNNLMSSNIKIKNKIYFQQPLYENKFETINKKNDHKSNSPYNNKYGKKIEENEYEDSKITFIKQIPKNYKTPIKMKSFYNLKNINYTSLTNSNSKLNLNSLLYENNKFNSENVKENLNFIRNTNISEKKYLNNSKNSIDTDKIYTNKLHRYNSFNKKLNSSLYKHKFKGLFNSINSRQTNLSMEKISQSKDTFLSNIHEFNTNTLGKKVKNRNKFLIKSHSTSFTNLFENNKDYTFLDEFNKKIKENKEVNNFLKGILPGTKLMKKIIHTSSKDIISNTGAFNLPLVSSINK